MDKIDGGQEKAAAEQIDQCLQRLPADVIDLLQHHEVIRLEDPDHIFAEGGAQEAVLAAQKARKVRFIKHHRPRTRSSTCACMRWRRLPLRRGADAAQRDGCALPQLRARRAARARSRRDRAMT